MRILKGKHEIRSVADWREYAGPKLPQQWAPGRSACELATAWFRTGQAAEPRELRDLLESRVETRSLQIADVFPEHQIRFDAHRGEPRNADIAFVGRGKAGLVAVTVEAKGDETFGPTVSAALGDALERRLAKTASRGMRRIRDLALSLVPALEPPVKGARRRPIAAVGALRYQLLTAVAGTLAYAEQNSARSAVLIVHEFQTTETSPENHGANARDYDAFLHRLGVKAGVNRELLGPVAIPGGPLFSKRTALFIGKVVTDTRKH